MVSGVKSLLQAVAWWADTVLTACWPEPERLPSLDDLAAQHLADKEAEEEVAEPRECGPFGHVVWPEEPDPLGHLIALVEDIRNTLSSASLSVADGPGEVEPPASPGQPNLTKDDLYEAAWAVEIVSSKAVGEGAKSDWEKLRVRLARAADAASK
jgi:hypothetical protein